MLVRTPPKISDSLTTVPPAVSLGQTAELKCIANGYPRPSVSWKREYNAILPGGGHIYRSFGVLAIATNNAKLPF